MRLWIQVERWRGQLRSGLTNIEADERPLASVLELRNEAWMHTILSENPIKMSRNSLTGNSTSSASTSTSWPDARLTRAPNPLTFCNDRVNRAPNRLPSSVEPRNICDGVSLGWPCAVPPLVPQSIETDLSNRAIQKTDVDPAVVPVDAEPP